MARVLLVDDDRLILQVLGQAIRDAGHEVIEAISGVKVPGLLSEEAPDILVTDIIMPDCEGMQTIRESRKAYPELPIIAMTAGSDISDTYLVAAKRFGANATLKKSHETQPLLDLIDQLTAA